MAASSDVTKLDSVIFVLFSFINITLTLPDTQKLLPYQISLKSIKTKKIV